MTEAPKRIWAWCFNLPEHGGWSNWGGHARPDNRYPLDEKERATGAEYILAAEHDRIVADARRAALEEAAKVVGLNAWKHGGEDAYSQGMDAGARHQNKADVDAIRALAEKR